MMSPNALHPPLHTIWMLPRSYWHRRFPETKGSSPLVDSIPKGNSRIQSGTSVSGSCATVKVREVPSDGLDLCDIENGMKAGSRREHGLHGDAGAFEPTVSRAAKKGAWNCRSKTDSSNTSRIRTPSGRRPGLAATAALGCVGRRTIFPPRPFFWLHGLQTLASAKRTEAIKASTVQLVCVVVRHTRPLDAHRNEVLDTKTACASRRLNPRHVGESPALVNNEDRVAVCQAHPSGECERPQETFHRVHDRAEVPNARSGDGDFEESIDDLVFKRSSRVAVPSRRR